MARLFTPVLRANSDHFPETDEGMRQAVVKTAGSVREYLLHCSNGQSRREAMMARQIVELLDDGISAQAGPLGQLADRILSRCHFCAGKEACPCPVLCQRLVMQVRDLEQAKACSPVRQ